MHSTPVVNRPPGQSHRVRAAIRSAIVLAPIALLAAGCGSGSHNSPSASSSSGHPTPAQARQAAVRFASCMRSRGVPNFPDPSSPHEFKSSISPDTARSPAFQSAYTACKHLLPGGGPNAALQARRQRQERAGLLAFAQCMRRHGLTRFPDPNSQGELTQQMATAAGIDIHAPSVAADARACVPASHGTITPADVARATSGQ
jgi:hypothetical protein